MKPWQRNLVLFGVLILGLGTAAVYGIQAIDTQKYEETKQVDGSSITSISIEGVTGNVSVTPSADNQASVHLYGKGRADTYTLDVQNTNGKLIVQLNKLTTPGGWFNLPEDLKLDVKLPRKGYDTFTAKTASGNLAIADLQAKTVETNTMSGNQDLQRISGDLATLQAASGNLTLSDINASLNVKVMSGDIIGHKTSGQKITTYSASGNVQLDGLRGEVNSESTSGNVRLDYDKLNSNLNLDISSGDTDLYLPSDAAFDVKFEASSGNFTSNFALANRTDTDNSHQGSVGSGGSLLSVHAASGNLTLHKK